MKTYNMVLKSVTMGTGHVPWDLEYPVDYSGCGNFSYDDNLVTDLSHALNVLTIVAHPATGFDPLDLEYPSDYIGCGNHGYDANVVTFQDDIQKLHPFTFDSEFELAS